MTSALKSNVQPPKNRKQGHSPHYHGIATTATPASCKDQVGAKLTADSNLKGQPSEPHYRENFQFLHPNDKVINKTSAGVSKAHITNDTICKASLYTTALCCCCMRNCPHTTHRIGCELHTPALTSSLYCHLSTACHKGLSWRTYREKLSRPVFLEFCSKIPNMPLLLQEQAWYERKCGKVKDWRQHCLAPVHHVIMDSDATN